MAVIETKRIRNVALLGHGGSGKTSLAEAMLYITGTADRLGKVSDGNTVSDYDSEEIKRGFSLSTSIMNMVERLGLDTVVSPKDVIANHIVRFIRAHQAETGNGINTMYKLDDKVEALEFTVRENFVKQGIPLKKLSLKKNVLIGGIVRGGEFILPDGETTMLAGDRVIVVTASKQITDLTQILR